MLDRVFILYKTSVGIMPGGMTMEKTREIEERNRK